MTVLDTSAGAAAISIEAVPRLICEWGTVARREWGTVARREWGTVARREWGTVARRETVGCARYSSRRQWFGFLPHAQRVFDGGVEGVQIHTEQPGRPKLTQLTRLARELAQLIRIARVVGEEVALEALHQWQDQLGILRGDGRGDPR